jgi:hypothetical protein
MSTHFPRLLYGSHAWEYFLRIRVPKVTKKKLRMTFTSDIPEQYLNLFESKLDEICALKVQEIQVESHVEVAIQVKFVSN